MLCVIFVWVFLQHDKAYVFRRGFYNRRIGVRVLCIGHQFIQFLVDTGEQTNVCFKQRELNFANVDIVQSHFAGDQFVGQLLTVQHQLIVHQITIFALFGLCVYGSLGDVLRKPIEEWLVLLAVEKPFVQPDIPKDFHILETQHNKIMYLCADAANLELTFTDPLILGKDAALVS